MLLDVKLGGLLLFFCRGNHHCFVGAVDLEENGHLFAISVFPLFCILKLLILLISIFVVDQMIKNMAWIRNLKILPRLKCHLNIFWKSLRKQHPNTISIQLQRLAYPCLDILLTITDDIGSEICDHSCHLHRIPPCAFSHDVAIETIENDLMGELHRFVEDHEALGFLSTTSIFSLTQSFVFVLCCFC